MAPAIEQHTCTVVLHDDTTSTEDILCSADLLPPGRIGLLTAPGAKPLCVVKPSEASRTGEISVHVSLAHAFGFENRMRASIRLVENVETATATHVEILLRDQHLSRADMWRIRDQVDGCMLSRAQKLSFLGPSTASVEAMYIDGKEMHSALVSHPRTKLIFRSASARFTILIQLSKEMIESWRGTDIMFERVIDGFLPELFQRWDRLKARHQISVVLFGRQRKQQTLATGFGEVQTPDFYHVIALDAPSSNWRELRRLLKIAFSKLQFPRALSLAAKGNVLEALYTAALDLANNNVDQHMVSTGSSIIAITAGSGLFEAEHEKLRSFTQLLTGSNTGVDIVSVAPKPLHPVPLFQYDLEGRVEYALPHWSDISFWSSEDDSDDDDPLWNLPPPTTEPERISTPWLHNSEIMLTGFSEEAFEAFDDATFAAACPAVPTSTIAMQRAAEKRPAKKEPAETKEVSQTAIGAAPVQSDIKATAVSCATPSESSRPGTPQDRSTTEFRTLKKASSLRHPLLQSNRKISLGPRGLASSFGVASTGVSAQYAQQDKDQLASLLFSTSEARSDLSKHMRGTLRKRPSYQSILSNPASEAPSTTQPLDIEIPRSSAETPRDPASLVEEAVLEPIAQSAEESGDTQPTAAVAESENILPPKLSTAIDPMESVTPWLTLINPCNPREDNMRLAGEYRQWQNIFPRMVSSDEFKWESMCNPAALPLLREWRPSQNDLETLFDKKIRRLVVTTTAEPQMAQRAMVQMIHMRLNAGFQVVSLHKQPSEQADRILLALGTHYQEICHLSESEIQVTEYEKRSELEEDEKNENFIAPSSIEYIAEIKAALSRKERTIDLGLKQQHTPPDWSDLDDQCMNGTASTGLGANRTRFVLIPVGTLQGERQGLAGAKELTDEEHRLEGIQKLTQIWQRNRYFSDEDQRHQASMVKPKGSGAVERDPNPLAIEYQTRDTSTVVGVYGLNLAKVGDGEPMSKLFSESEQYHTSNFDVMKLAKQMQQPPPEGVEFKDRRWLTRLHYKCFRGDEMTNWLLRVFKDLQTREDAVALGNQLMDRGIFTHVRGKHEFRDGNYFYQIKAAHRTTDYPDTAGFFGRPVGRSVPSTPMSDVKQSPAVRPTQIDSDSPGKSNSTPTLAPVGSNKDRKLVLLSQKLQYNVDTGRKSNQLEIINVHYDRIHNPDNCYHILIDWTSTTTKLIRESVMRWAALVESHGLRLVQLPILEACKIGQNHPFEQTISLTLAARPPIKDPTTPHLEANASPRGAVDDTEGFHKAILRKLDFVLDSEAAHNFPRNVDVSYSWGRPSYMHTQFIHKSGLMLAQIVNDGQRDFLLLPNRLGSSVMTSTARRVELPTLEGILEKIVSFCQDESSLTELYESALMEGYSQVEKPNKLSAASPLVSDALPADGEIPPMELPPKLGHRSLLRNAG